MNKSRENLGIGHLKKFQTWVETARKRTRFRGKLPMKRSVGRRGVVTHLLEIYHDNFNVPVEYLVRGDFLSGPPNLKVLSTEKLI